jgi:acyl carrier protein
VTPVTADDVRSAVLERVSPGLAAKGLRPEELPDDFDLLLEGVVDSFGLLELISHVEARFGLELDFADLDADDLTALGPFSRYVETKSREHAGT